MNRTPETGVFGKLPAHGDFIYRNLPSHFINAWDAWLQGFIANSQQELGEHWLDTYLTSPIWRFAFSDGIIDDSHWVGILLPSVDRVGRYFPFSVAARVQTPTNAFALIEQEQWLNEIEELALSALHGQLRLDDLVDALAALKLSAPRATPRHLSCAQGIGSVLCLDTPELEQQPLTRAFSQMMDALMRAQAPTYSLWCTANGSQQVAPTLAAIQGLPSVSSTTALLDGNWQESGWTVHGAAPSPAPNDTAHCISDPLLTE